MRNLILIVTFVIAVGVATFLWLGREESPSSVGPPAVPPEQWTDETGVVDVLAFLGETRPEHFVEPSDPELVKTGETLALSGRIRQPDGERTPSLSSYFRCVDCHNTVPEESNLAKISDPAAKLDFAVANDIPLLQGSTFAGMVNRESWYNDDYAKKYRFSVAVRSARSDLRKAIHLCCKECSQGRYPEPWEEEALLAYFCSLQWTIGDLGLAAADLAEWKTRAVDPANREALVQDIKSRYAQKSPATFGEMPTDGKAGFVLGEDEVPDPVVGEQVFERACLHCHDPAEGAAETYFKNDEKNRADLSRKFNNSKKSIYGYIRLGTHPEDGQRLYMPNYTKERLSDFQIESLRAWLENGTADD